jgi:hypothetical protein
MKHLTAYIGLAILTIGLSACTGSSTGSASLVPQTHVTHVQCEGCGDDVGGGGGPTGG